MAETSWTATKTGLLVPERRTIAVDLFADARGFSLGFHRAGWPRWPPPSSTPTMISSVPARRGPRFIDP